jgi:hypothetical protein
MGFFSISARLFAERPADGLNWGLCKIWLNTLIGGLHFWHLLKGLIALVYMAYQIS